MNLFWECFVLDKTSLQLILSDVDGSKWGINLFKTNRKRDAFVFSNVESVKKLELRGDP